MDFKRAAFASTSITSERPSSFLSRKRRSEALKRSVTSGRQSPIDKSTHNGWGLNREESTNYCQLGFVEFLEFIASQFPEDIKELFECKNVDGKTPLHEAAQFSQTDIITFLLVHNVQVDPIKKADWTPLMLACTKTGKESQKSINMLISKGADLMLQNKVLIYYLCYSHSFYEILIFF